MQKKLEKRIKEVLVQAQARRDTILRNVENLWRMETVEQAEIRRKHNAENMASWRSSSATNQNIQNESEVPLISRYVETEEAKQKVFLPHDENKNRACLLWQIHM